MQNFSAQVLADSFVPTHILIGTEHKKDKKFDDLEPLAKIGGHYKINAISVFWDEQHIRGIQVYYKIGKDSIGDFLDAVHNKPNPKEKGNDKTHGALFEIGPDDYILEINGKTADGFINKLGFVTYRGKTNSFGIDQGEDFKYRHNNHTFGAIAGGHRDYLDFLSIPVLPAPKEFLLGINPVAVNLNVTLPQKPLQSQPVVLINNPTKPPSSQGGNGGEVAYVVKKEFMQINIPGVPQRSYTNPVNPIAPSVNSFGPSNSFSSNPVNPYSQPSYPGQIGYHQPQVQVPVANFNIQQQPNNYNNFQPSYPQQNQVNPSASLGNGNGLTGSRYPVLKK